MFKTFFQETKWLLIVTLSIILILLGNIAYIVWEDGKLARENVGIPDFHWDPDMQTKAKDLKGVEFKLLKNNLYSLTGTIRENDCEKVVSRRSNCLCARAGLVRSVGCWPR